MLPLAIIGAILFWGWLAADVASIAVTGEDTIYHFMNFMGWSGTLATGPGDNIIIEWGMDGLEFLMNYWTFICLFLGVVCFTIWASTRPLKQKTKVKT